MSRKVKPFPGRNFEDCKDCVHCRSSACLTCTMGQNFEPRPTVAELDFNDNFPSGGFYGEDEEG